MPFFCNEDLSLHYLVEATNASLLALLTDQPLPPRARWVRDTPTRARALSLAGSIAEEHAMGAGPGRRSSVQPRPALNTANMSSSSALWVSALSPSNFKHSSAVMGRANRKPCPTVQPNRRKISAC
jgi:hypothetical protein